MKRAACALALALTTTAAHADDFVVDVRAPARYGFAYTTLTRGPALSFSWGIDADLVRITRDSTFQLVFDFDSSTRLDLDDKIPARRSRASGSAAGSSTSAKRKSASASRRASA